MNFDDPKPPQDTRIMQMIYLRPSLKERIDLARGALSRSAWIEEAIRAKLATEKGRSG
jgi:hypothetical protein